MRIDTADMLNANLNRAAWVLGMSLALGISAPAIAQMAEVPLPNRNGDYTTAVLRGNRGNFYYNRRWLVVDPDPTYLNCRVSPNGVVRSRIAPGAILMAEFIQNEAIVFHNGSPWLRVRGIDALTVPQRGQTLGRCYVRANRQYIAPINEDARLN
ncbi:MAG TPA: hypothetical protein IGS37_17910 [Synechococcales cyanobacterium M55_K2018_004]|nr:hypothetical protein [Synechococcales cyanobacterium M55_K2018_004]